MLPIALFRDSEGNIDTVALDQFVQALKAGSVEDAFSADVETRAIREQDKLLDVLPLVKESKHGFLPVVDNDRRMIGVIDEEAVFALIAEEVYVAQKTR